MTHKSAMTIARPAAIKANYRVAMPTAWPGLSLALNCLVPGRAQGNVIQGHDIMQPINE